MKLSHLLLLPCIVLLACSASAQTGYTQEGHASYYADKFHGRTTASGERYDANKMTCAHMTLPYGTTLHVTNLANAKSIIVRVNDRGPFVPNRIIDLSRRAAEAIGMIEAGVVKVRIETVPTTELERQSPPPPVAVHPSANREASQNAVSPQTTVPPPATPEQPTPPTPTSAVVANGSIKGQLPDGRDFFLRIHTPQGAQYGVQVASYRDVNNLVKAIANWDYATRSKVLILAPNETAGTVYKVVIGSHATRAEAETLQQSLTERFPGCFIVGL